MKRELSKDILVERSILKTYRRDIWYNFVAAIKQYQLIEPNDNIMVCISGGKDSILMAKCFQLLHRYSDFNFDVRYVVMDPGYSKENRQLIESNCRLLNIPIEIFDTPIFDSTLKVDDNPCYLCARMRRGYLYRYAKKIGCNKIALGHHQDDVMETFMMNLLYNGSVKAMMPKLYSDNVEGLELIRPLYMVREKAIINWMNHNELKFLRCACKLTQAIARGDDELTSKRYETKQLIKELAKIDKNVEKNIFQAASNVVLDKIIEYKSNNKVYNFLDNYKDNRPTYYHDSKEEYDIKNE